MRLSSKFIYKAKKTLHNRRSSSIIGLLTVIALLFFIFRSNPIDKNPNEVFRIGIDNRWRDIEIYGKEKNLNAFSHDLLQLIALKEKVKFKLLYFSSNEMYNLLTEDTLDAILTSLPPSEIEERTYYFSHNAYPLGPVLNLSDETTVKSWQDLTEKIVGVYAFSPTILQLQKIYNIKLRLNDDIKQAFQDLENHIIDAAIYPALPSITYINTFYSNKLKVVSNVLNNEGIHLVTLNNDEGKKIIDIFNQGLKQVKEDGLLNQLLERWNLVDTTALEENVNFEAIEKMHG